MAAIICLEDVPTCTQAAGSPTATVPSLYVPNIKPMVFSCNGLVHARQDFVQGIGRETDSCVREKERQVEIS